MHYIAQASRCLAFDLDTYNIQTSNLITFNQWQCIASAVSLLKAEWIRLYTSLRILWSEHLLKIGHGISLDHATPCFLPASFSVEVGMRLPNSRRLGLSERTWYLGRKSLVLGEIDALVLIFSA